MSASAELGYGWLALVALAGLAWYGIRLHHRREMARVELAELEVEGWVRLKAQAIPHFWQCPDCGLPAVTLEGMRVHQDPGLSACAYFAERARERAEAGEAAAEDGEWRVDPWPSLAEDAETVSAAQRTELEGSGEQ